jgi:hypothetical protein
MKAASHSFIHSLLTLTLRKKSYHCFNTCPPDAPATSFPGAWMFSLFPGLSFLLVVVVTNDDDEDDVFVIRLRQMYAYTGFSSCVVEVLVSFGKMCTETPRQ